MQADAARVGFTAVARRRVRICGGSDRGGGGRESCWGGGRPAAPGRGNRFPGRRRGRGRGVSGCSESLDAPDPRRERSSGRGLVGDVRRVVAAVGGDSGGWFGSRRREGSTHAWRRRHTWTIYGASSEGRTLGAPSPPPSPPPAFRVSPPRGRPTDLSLTTGACLRRAPPPSTRMSPQNPALPSVLPARRRACGTP